MEIAMTTIQMNVEKKRVFDLNLTLFWIEEARIKIGIQEFNLSSSSVAGEGIKYSNRIEILKQSINRLNNRYFKTLNK